MASSPESSKIGSVFQYSRWHVNLELGKIDLRLVTWFRFESHAGQFLTLALELMNLSFDDLVAAGKAHVDQPLINPVAV